MVRPPVLAALAASSVLASGGAARADLGDDAARVARIWAERGAQVERLPPIFVEHGRPHRVTLPPARDPGGKGCATLALIAVRTAEFTVGPARSLPLGPGAAASGSEGAARGAGADPRPGLLPREGAEGASRRHSAGGAATLVRCGAARAELARVAVELISTRAAMELVLARSEAALVEPSEILPERASGPFAPRGETGGPLEPGPLAERVARAERRARADGAGQVTRSVVRAGPTGAGQAALPLDGGCHRIDVMAEVPPAFPHRATDVDAEAHDAAGKLLARDRADVPDARLDFCLGQPAEVSIAFAGAAGAVPVTLSDARWALPAHLPSRWGPRARAGFAGALFRRRAPAPQGEPIFETLGAQGPTAVSLPVQPGRCYLAALAPIRGETRHIRLAATVGDRVARDEAAERPEGAALSFCVQNEAVARFDADVRGNAAWWALAVWPMGSVSP